MNLVIIFGGFFSVWVLLFTFVFAAWYFFGSDGAVPIFWLVLGVISSMFISTIIYTVAILVQYRNGEKNCE